MLEWDPTANCYLQSAITKNKNKGTEGIRRSTYTILIVKYLIWEETEIKYHYIVTGDHKICNI